MVCRSWIISVATERCVLTSHINIGISWHPHVDMDRDQDWAGTRSDFQVRDCGLSVFQNWCPRPWRVATLLCTRIFLVLGHDSKLRWRKFGTGHGILVLFKFGQILDIDVLDGQRPDVVGRSWYFRSQFFLPLDFWKNNSSSCPSSFFPWAEVNILSLVIGWPFGNCPPWRCLK